MYIVKKVFGRRSNAVEPELSPALEIRPPDDKLGSQPTEPPAWTTAWEETGGRGQPADFKEPPLVAAAEQAPLAGNQDWGFPQDDLLKLLGEVDTRDEELQRLAGGLEEVDVHVLALECNLVATEARMSRPRARPHK